MIDTKEATLSSFLYNVKEKAAGLKTAQFYSMTKRIEPVSLLQIFDKYHQKKENRYYWSNNHADFHLLGIGTAKEIVSEDGNIETVREKWENIIKLAEEHNPYGLSGTGITAVGGMAFDPAEDCKEQWKNYPPAKLVIPKYMITYTAGSYFLTVNDTMDKNTFISDVMEAVREFEQFIGTENMVTSEVPQSVVNKKELKPEAWKSLVQKAVDEIKSDAVKKIVLAREIRVKLNKQAHIGNMLRRLERTQPNSYVFAYEAGKDCFLGATPERLVLVEGKSLLSTCLAGTAPRGETEIADQAIADDLLHDEKNLEEHGYVVQMIKNSIGGYCDRIVIPEKPVIYPLKNLQHLYTPVKATIKDKHDVFDLIKSLHPTPALGGVPREKALMFIREEEFMSRGWYGAPVGWLDSGKHSEFAVAIRSGLIRNDEVSLFAGCGVMRDSDPEMEFEETKVKFLPMLNVLEDDDGTY